MKDTTGRTKTKTRIRMKRQYDEAAQEEQEEDK